jgi:hypothetical protein
METAVNGKRFCMGKPVLDDVSSGIQEPVGIILKYGLVQEERAKREEKERAAIVQKTASRHRLR